MDGVVYVKVKGADAKILKYTATGLEESDIEAADANTTNICHDDAGNIIYRQSSGFPSPPSNINADVLTVIDTEGERHQITLPLARNGLPSTRLDFYSNVVGNILEGDAYFFYPENGTSNLYIVCITDGKVNPDKCGVVELSDAYSDTNTMIYPFGENKFIHHYRGANPILYSYYYDGEENKWVVNKEGNIDCPNRYNSSGISTFNLNGVDYIVYPTGTGYYDGFSIAELTTDGTTEEPVAVWEQTTTAQTSGFQTDWVFAEKVDEETALIYQYFPGGWVKVFRFTAGDTAPGEFPAQLYAAGSYNNWNYADCTAMEQDAYLTGVYTTSNEISFANNGALIFSEANGTESAFNVAKWGVSTTTSVNGTESFLIEKGGENISVAGGTYSFTVDLLTRKVLATITAPTAIQNTIADVKASYVTKSIQNGQIVIKKAGVKYSAAGQIIK